MTDELVMGFDFGTTRIGVAVGHSLTGTATALTALGARDGSPDWEAVAKLVTEWQPARFVVGLPLNMDGTESEMSALARKFARRLHGRFRVPCETMDERLSSHEARELAEPNESVDAVAARLILESWFRSR